MIGDMRRMDMVVDELERQRTHYTADELMRRYRAVMTGNTLRVCAERLATTLEREGVARTAAAYRTASARLVAFNNGRDPHLDQMSATMLGDFQYSLKAEGLKPNTISFYMRTLRAIYNRAVTEGRTARRTENIFAGVYTGVAPTRKLALTANELALLAAYDPTLTEGRSTSHQPLPLHLAQALAMFLFCYHARGMCFVDMAHLKKADLRGETIAYHRQKTGQRIELLVLPAMRRIIDWFAPHTAGSPYVFPVLTDPDRDLDLQYTSGLRLQNLRLKNVAQKCGISKKRRKKLQPPLSRDKRRSGPLEPTNNRDLSRLARALDPRQRLKARVQRHRTQHHAHHHPQTTPHGNVLKRGREATTTNRLLQCAGAGSVIRGREPRAAIYLEVGYAGESHGSGPFSRLSEAQRIPRFIISSAWGTAKSAATWPRAL